MRLHHAAALLAALFLPATQALAQDIQPGQWEMNIQTVAGGKTHDQTVRQCLTPADAKEPAGVIASQGGATFGCALSDQRRSAGRIDFAVSCKVVGGIGGRGSVEYTATTLRGNMSLEFRGEGSAAMPGGFQSTMSGRRTGNC
jgi:hypothetical protein